MHEHNLVDRLERIEKFETELVGKSASVVGANLSPADFYMFGALERTLAQARGFRDLITSCNYPCAAAILRLQLDTAMRVNALSLVDNADEACTVVLGGEKFNQLKDRDNKKLTDAYLRGKLAERYPWIDSVYKKTSDFVHLSGSHFYSTIFEFDEKTRTMKFVVGGIDRNISEESYFEAVDAFFEATKIAGNLLLDFWRARHQR